MKSMRTTFVLKNFHQMEANIDDLKNVLERYVDALLFVDTRSHRRRIEAVNIVARLEYFLPVLTQYSRNSDPTK